MQHKSPYPLVNPVTKAAGTGLPHILLCTQMKRDRAKNVSLISTKSIPSSYVCMYLHCVLSLCECYIIPKPSVPSLIASSKARSKCS
jgi:hypothetical protein